VQELWTSRSHVPTGWQKVIVKEEKLELGFASEKTLGGGTAIDVDLCHPFGEGRGGAGSS